MIGTPADRAISDLTRRMLLRVAAAGLISGLAPRITLAAAPAELKGLNFSFLDVDRQKVGACSRLGRGAPIQGKAFLPRYRDPGVRDAVKAILEKLHADAITAIRHNLWFINDDKAPRDVFAVKDVTKATDMLGLFVEDMKAAGLAQLFLAMSPVGRTIPACRKAEWGDCFRADTVGSTTDFISKVATAAAGPLGRNLYLDSVNEGVPSDALKPPLRARMLDFLGDCLRAAAAVRPAPRIVVSTQGNRAAERIRILEDLLRKTKIHLDVLDIHVYRGRGSGPDAATLAAFRDFAHRIGAALLVGEIQADPELIERIRTALQKNDEGDPIGFFPWPLGNAASGCHADMDVPDMLNTIHRVRRRKD
jgi:hypothetical protein